MSRLMIRPVVTLALVFGLLLVGVSGCGGDDAAGSGSVNVPAAEPQQADPTTHPAPVPEPEPEPAPEPEPSDPSTDPTTNPCAFPGDPLCPGTPVDVPPPDLTGW